MIFEKQYRGQNNSILSSLLNNTQSQSLQSQLYLINSIESIDLQQNCLVRLKKQREKIQEMIIINEQMHRQVKGLQQQKIGLEKRVGELQQGYEYKEKYMQLKGQFQRMMNSHQLAEYQIEQLKIELQNSITGFESQRSELKIIIKRQREQKLFKVCSLQQIIEEKEKEIIQLRRQFKSTQKNLLSKLEQLQLENQNLRQSIQSQGIELEQTDQIFKKTIKTKEADIIGYEKIVQKLKKQVKTLKFDLNSRKYEHQRQKQEYYQALQQTRTALKLLSKEKELKDNQNYQLKQQVRRYQGKNKGLEQTITNLKLTNNKLKKTSQSVKSKSYQFHQAEKAKLQQTNNRLKKQIERHVEEYNMLLIQFKRVKSILQCKQQSQKQRKWLLMNEFRELDKIQREINRVK